MKKPYDIGLDIGTGSCGWATVYQDGIMPKFKSRNMWGAVLIPEAGETAEKRRLFRSSRRRLVRKKQRIMWIQELLADFVLREDKTFYERLKYSYYSKDDETAEISPAILFDNNFYMGHDYHLEFPTIYHLRKALIDADKKYDPRLIYLAIHHIVKYRGNFLYEGQQIEIKNLDIEGSVNDLLIALELQDDDSDSVYFDKIAKILKSEDSKGEKRDQLVEVFTLLAPEEYNGKVKQWASAISGLLIGYKCDVSSFLEVDDKTKCSFADDSYLDLMDKLPDDEVVKLEAIQKVYSGFVLQSILAGDVKTLSDAYIKVYDKHKKDLKILKALIKTCVPYKYFDIINATKENIISYNSYISGTAQCSQEALINKIKKIIEPVIAEQRENLEKLKTELLKSGVLEEDLIKESCIADNILNNEDFQSLLNRIEDETLFQKPIDINHKNDLIILKDFLKSYIPNEYYDLIEANNKKVISYATYISGTSQCSQEDLINKIKKTIEPIINGDMEKLEHVKLDLLKDDISEADFQSFLNRIEDKTLFQKPRNPENGVIPNQLHCEELERIIDAQGKYYPELLELKSKLLSIASFRIPYYVGPLSGTKSPFGWAERREEGKIYPWNIEDKIDFEKAGESFIRRMTNKCTYLINEDVLPKNSLLISKFNVLNELANIRINDKHLAPDCKMAAFNSLFLQSKKVSKKSFIAWLKNNHYLEDNNVEVEGFSDTTGFLSSRSSFIDFMTIAPTLEESEVEEIINWITLFEDKRILESKLRTSYPQLDEIAITKLLKLRYKGWGRLSARLLTGIHSMKASGEIVSIMDLLESTEMNFMEIIYSEEFGFNGIIDKENELFLKDKNYSKKELVLSYPGSPALKKTSLVAVKIVDEIVKVMGYQPTNIFIEVASGEDTKKRTKSRYKQLKEKYDKVAKNPEFEEVAKELSLYKEKEKEFDNKRLLLYFLQNGKCLYSGKPLQIENLSNYQIDHILPQCYIKDDSLDNLALVLASENQRKRDSLLLDDGIITSQISNWKNLKDKDFMSTKKFNNLTRSKVDEQQLKGFIERQLVETRQISTNVFNALKAVYGSSISVFGVSAKLSSNIRKRLNLVKIRDVNDYHHAQDALLAARAGFFIQKRFTVIQSQQLQEYSALFKETDIERKEKYGILAAYFVKNLINWNGREEELRLRKVMGYFDYYINRLVSEQTGAFYKQTFISKNDNPENLIPKKDNLSPKLYGGLTGEEDAYFCIVEYLNKKKKCLKIVGIPIRIVACMETNGNAINEYFDSLHLVGAVIKRNRILKHQHILYEENDGQISDYYMVGESEVINARQLFLPSKILKQLNNILRGSFENNDVNIQLIYEEMCRKLNMYNCYRKIGEILERSINEFMDLNKEDKIEVFKDMLIAMQCNSSRVDAWKMMGIDGNGKEVKIPTTRLTKTLKPQNITFVDSSITGMFERKSKIEL